MKIGALARSDSEGMSLLRGLSVVANLNMVKSAAHNSQQSWT